MTTATKSLLRQLAYVTALTLMLMMLSACSSTTAPVVTQQFYIRMEKKLDSLQVGNMEQNHIALRAETNIPADSGRIIWVSDTYGAYQSAGVGQTDTVSTVNCCSYADGSGVVTTMFSANSPFAGLTAMVVASANINGKLVADSMYIKMY